MHKRIIHNQTPFTLNLEGMTIHPGVSVIELLGNHIELDICGELLYSGMPHEHIYVTTAAIRDTLHPNDMWIANWRYHQFRTFSSKKEINIHTDQSHIIWILAIMFALIFAMDR